MDRITASLLKEFSEEAGIAGLPDDKRFEHFATFLAVSRHLGEAFETADLVTGGGADTGIDGLAILVNGVLMTDPEQVDDLAETNGYVDATFIFVQAQRSSSFQSSKIGQFGFGVVDFFAETPQLSRSGQIDSSATVMNAIYQHSSKFKRGNPACRLHYVTTGRWSDDADPEARRRAVTGDLERLGIFRDVQFSPIGASEIQKLYNETKNAISREFTFAARTVVPDIEGVTEAYLGLLPATEFIRLLDDGDGEIIKSIFYDNVRDWQDYNKVNSEIKATLQSPAKRKLFSLMNNGVTLIAKKLRATGNRFHIEDFQIVNGCQTSHVLFDNKELIDDTVVVPLRIIATENEDVIAAISKATNRQTQIKEEQLIALSDFQKKLEAYFQTFEPPHRLFYERRSRQYNSTPGIEKTRIVTPANLIRAYASILSRGASPYNSDISRLDRLAG